MTSRRTMTHSYTGNGRYGSQNGEDVLSPRLDSCNYLSSVRPENRSTFCTVMSQLTEETQPSFETTIKSKAVSEACNVKFTCVVTGYPVPELTWYKDDMELDRYCGLPKYEIFRTGKIHTLHIYNCTVDDAAIYQASARNSKGIVSCSGVLEVGTMSEYKIHQRFFAKLKQKAELKQRELEHSSCQEKEHTLQEQVSSSQNNVRWTDGVLHNSSSVHVQEDSEEKEKEITEQQPEALNDELNRLSFKVHGCPSKSDRSQEKDVHHTSSDIGQNNGNQQYISVSEKAEISGTTPFTKEKVSRNNMISNGFDKPFTIQSIEAAGDGRVTHEGNSLAKILVNSLQLKFGEAHQKNTVQSQEITSINASTTENREKDQEVDTEGQKIKADDRHQERQTLWEGENKRSEEKEQENFRQLKPEHRAAATSEAKTSAYKEPEYQHKSSLSLVFHSLKDIFFGKSKKSPEIIDSKKVSDLNVEKEILAINTEAHCHLQQTQPKGSDTTSGVCGTNHEHLVPMTIGQQTLCVNAPFSKETPSSHIKNEMENVNLANHIHGFATNYIKGIYQASKIYHESVEVEKEACQEVLQNSTLLTICEVSDDNTHPNNDKQMAQVCQDTIGQEYTAPIDQIGELEAVKKQDEIANFTVMSTDFMPQPNRTDLESCKNYPDAQISTPVSQETHLVNKNGIMEDEKIQECNSNKDSKEMFTANSSDSTKNSETDTVNVTERISVSAYERNQQCNAISQDKSTSVFNTNPGESLQVMESDITQNKHLVLNNVIENIQGFEAGSVRQDSKKVEIINSLRNKDNNIEAKKVDSIDKMKEKQDDRKEKNTDNATEQKGDSKGKSTNYISEQGTGISVYEKPPDTEVLKTHVNSKEIEKTNIYAKVQQEKHTAESRDQSDVSSIIILPDTRETVIKNVAKMRAIPLTQEIKVAVPERVKHEDHFSVPRKDVLLSEPGRVIPPLVHEVALIYRGNDSTFEDPNASRAPNQNTRDDSMVITGEPINAIVSQHEKNSWLLSDLETTETEYLEDPTGNMEDPSRTSTGWSRGNDSNNIPLINIACADDIAVLEKMETNNEKSVFIDTVQQGNAALKMQDDSSSFIPITHLESSGEMVIKDEIISESLSSILKEVMGHFDSEVSHNTNQEGEKPTPQKEGNERRHFVKIQNNSDVSSVISPKVLQNSSTFDTEVCQDKESKVESDANRLQREKPAMEKLGLTTPVGPTLPPLSPASLRRLMAKNNPNLENQGSTVTVLGDGNEKKGEDSGGSTPTSNLSCESSPKMKRRDSLTLIPSATPEELASGARRKIYLTKTKSEDECSDSQSRRDSPYISPSQARRAALLQLQSGQQAQNMEKLSPLLGRRKTMVEVQKPKDEPLQLNLPNSKTAGKEKLDPYKAPQVFRKIRGEPFSDALGHLKLWCQFFNVFSDSTIKWFKDDVEIAEVKRSAGDESQVVLAIVQASSNDCGVYGCSIKNEYGTDTTDYLLSSEILTEIVLRDDSKVGEEIEMTPLLFTKGLVDPGYWGNKFFGRIMTEELQIGEGCVHKNSRAKVIYGLDPIFESGSTCIVKVKNHIAYGTKEENCLADINLEITKQECKIHNTVREYCKIFAAEARVFENFGLAIEVIPLYLIYRPANTIPYATMEADLNGVYLKYCTVDNNENLITQTTSEVGQKCCTFQHWIYQWTNGNLLVTQLEGVDTQITNVKLATKTKGYQSLTEEGSPKILEQFVIQHQCNYYCGLLDLRPLAIMDSLQQTKIKTSRSPMLARKMGLTDSSSPQLLKKCSSSPQTGKNVNTSPKLAKKTDED